MSLIEQLGGYEETKKHLDSCWCDDDNKAYLLEKLLEYRRQHNIFEDGDRFVIDGLFGVFYANDGNIPYLDYNMIRHATDAEIKAGKRLEVANENISNHN